MPFNDELQFERTLINFLTTNCGWEKEIIKYPTEEDLINNWARILYENNKETNLLNGCPLTEGEMAQIITQVNTLKTPIALNSFINGKTVSIRRDNPNDTLHFGKSVSLKIYDRMEIAGGKSRYQIAEQPVFKTNNSVYPSRRGDIMLLINGMPLYHIELKKSDIPLSQAQIQIEKYRNNGVFSGIFSLVQVFVTMTPEDAVYFSNPGPDGKFNKDFYFHWCDFNNEPIKEWSRFAKTLLSIPMAHEMIGFYSIPDDTDGVLKIMRSYQFYASSIISDIVAKTNWTKDEQHGGYVWHTTGSGKTMTSFKAAQLIANSRDADKVVFLLDRVELGEQSLNNYRNFANINESIQATENTQVLIGKLKSNSYDDVLIVTSIQKMSRIRDDGDIKKADLEKIKNKKIVFIIDECHRDQKGEMHQAIKQTFPNAIYFGFSGTPDHDFTPDIFGNEIHRYTIVNGINDKNVLGFDPYKVCTYDDKQLREIIGLEKVHATTVAEAMSDPIKRDKFLYYLNRGSQKCSMIEIEKEIPTSQYTRVEHQNAVVDDILANWEVRSVGSKFHSIFATSSIPEAIAYYKLFKQKNHKLHITAVFDPSDDNGSGSISKMIGITEILNDYKEMFGNEYNISTYPNFKKDVCARLAHKKPYQNLQESQKIDIIIVVDQLLTGFDSKWISTLYLDKLLKGKNLIQAISRTNRLFGPDKPHGTIVWYRYPHTMEENLLKAVNDYSGNRPFGIFVDKLESNLVQLNAKYDEIKSLFESVGINDFSKNYDDDSWKKKFSKLFSEFNKYLHSAKIQGFTWNKLNYVFKKENAPDTIVNLLLDEKLYLILVQRYKELFITGTGVGTELPYDIDTHITEIQTDTIDDAFLNSKFVLFVRNLNGGDQKAKEEALNELHKTFAYLSQEDQKYAKIFLHDVECGMIVETGKSFRDYITEYKCNAYNDELHRFAVGIGIDEEKLRNLINLHPTESDINSFGRYDDLIRTLDINKAKEYYENKNSTTLTLRQTKFLVDNDLRNRILNR